MADVRQGSAGEVLYSWSSETPSLGRRIAVAAVGAGLMATMAPGVAAVPNAHRMPVAYFGVPGAALGDVSWFGGMAMAAQPPQPFVFTQANYDLLLSTIEKVDVKVTSLASKVDSVQSKADNLDGKMSILLTVGVVIAASAIGVLVHAAGWIP